MYVIIFLEILTFVFRIPRTIKITMHIILIYDVSLKLNF